MSTVADTVRVRFVGAVRPAADDYTQHLTAWASSFDDAGGMLLPPRRALPLFVTESGEPVLVRNTWDGPTASAFPGDLPGMMVDAAAANFVPASDGSGYANSAYDRIAWQAAGNSGGHLLPGNDVPPKSGMFDQLKDAITDYAAGLPKSIAESVLRTSLTNALLGAGTNGILGGIPGSLLGGIPGLGAAMKTAGAVIDGLTPVAGKIGEALGFAAQPGATPSSLGNLLSTENLTAALSQVGDQLLSQWKVEDSDAMGEQLAHHCVDKYKSQLKNPQEALDKLQGYFTGQTVTPQFPALRITDMDLASDPIVASSANVFAEGLPLTRVGDVVKPPGVAVYMGGATVTTNGMMTARAGTSLSQAGPFAKGAATVFINGAAGGAPPPPKPPPAPPKSESTAAKGDGKAAPAKGGAAAKSEAKQPPAKADAKTEDAKTTDTKPADAKTEDAKQPPAKADAKTEDAKANDTESSGDGPSCSVQEAAKQLAPLAKDAYSESPEAPAGWTLKDRVDGRLGFNASIYEGEFQGRNTIVVAYGGTAGAMDGVSDVVNGLWGSDQYVQAVGLASAIRQQYPDANIVFTGHSLGGGMASFAGIMTNTPAIGFNAAGPLPPALLTFGAGNLAGLTNTSQASQHIIHVNAENDPLTNSVAGYPWSSNVYTVPLPKPPSENGVFQNLIYNHSIDNLNDALQNGSQLHPQKPDQLTSSDPGMSFHMDPMDAPPGTLMQPGQSNSPPVGGFLVDPVTGQIIYG